MDIFLSVVGLLVLLVCFWLWMASFSVCSLFGLPFVLLCFLSVYPFLSLSRYVPYPFRSMACKKRRGTQVQIVSRIDSPPPARPARPAQNHLRYRTVAWKTIHSPRGSIWSIGFGTGLAVRRRISSLGPISGPNNPKWTESDIGFNGWKFPISEPQGTCHTDGSSDPVLDL